MALIVAVIAVVTARVGNDEKVVAPPVGRPSSAEGSAGLRPPGAESGRTAEDAEPGRADDGGDECGQENDGEAEEDDAPTEEEKREAEEEKRVDDFDALTDKWMEPSSQGVTMADIDGFARAFRRIPKARQDECVHRALNLIPDENVMLLAGILMDKTMGEDVVETVYDDILNRDEDVKMPILQEIFKDKTHPCWADTAWILDVTDELPKAR